MAATGRSTGHVEYGTGLLIFTENKHAHVRCASSRQQQKHAFGLRRFRDITDRRFMSIHYFYSGCIPNDVSKIFFLVTRLVAYCN